MEPTRSPQATLNDLLDRILDKGIMLNTDLIVSVAGIPLLGVNLKLALAGMETMLKYGIMEDWDEAQRAVASKEIKSDGPLLEKGENIIFSVFGTHWYSKGIYQSWRSGTIYITNKRLILFRKMPAEVLLQIFYEEIQAMALKEVPHYTGVARQELHLLLGEGEIAKLHTKDSGNLKKAIENIIKTKGISLKDNLVFSDKKEVPGDFLKPEEEITHEGKLWYLMPLMTNKSTSYQWKPGHLYLTDKSLYWWYDFDKKLGVNIPIDKIMHVSLKDGSFGNVAIRTKALIVLYKDGKENKVVSFSGEETILEDWKKSIGKFIKENEDSKSTETCPRCGRKADRESLLENGCSRCGWISCRVK